jgi:hypothetical protein
MDAYRKGLTGAQAAWAAKKYRGHRVVPITILIELLGEGGSCSPSPHWICCPY